jgi:hypothetical protein
MKGVVMSTAAVQKVMVPATNDPAFIDTPFGQVVVFGHHLISKKDLIILGHCLDFPDAAEVRGNNGIKSIIFRDDNKPKTPAGVPVLGNVSFDHNSISINLLKIVSDAILEAQNKPEVAIIASYHRNLLMTILHEIHHLSAMDEFPTDPVEAQKEEEDAEAWGKEMLFHMAKTVDIEPAHHSESSFLAGQLMELLMEKTDDWSVKQRDMLNNHMFYHLPDKINRREVAIHSFKEYMKFQSPDFEDSIWSQPTIKGTIHVPVPTQALWDKGLPSSDLPPTPPATVAAAFNPVSTVVEEDNWVSIPEANIDHGDDGFDLPDFDDEGHQAGMQGYAQAQQQYQQPRQQYQPQAPSQQKITGPIKMYADTGLTEEQTAEVVKAFFFKCYNHIFGPCGPKEDSDVSFKDPKKVYEIGIPMTDLEKQVIVKMDCQDVNGRHCPGMDTTAGVVRGRLSEKKELPTYKLYINMKGYEICRFLLPQNCAKDNGAGGLSDQALAARAGSRIMYVKEGNDKLIPISGTWKFKIINDVWMKG